VRKTKGERSRHQRLNFFVEQTDTAYKHNQQSNTEIRRNKMLGHKYKIIKNKNIVACSIYKEQESEYLYSLGNIPIKK
jgi:hypothetical protein